MKTGLVLEGGGMRGLYTAGVLDAMMDHGMGADVICGTSAGVTFGINLPSAQRGRVLRYNTRFAGCREYISLHSLLTTGDVVNVKFAYDDLPNELDPFDYDTFKASGVEFYATATDVETGVPEYFRITDCHRNMDHIRASASLPFLSNIVEIDGRKYLDGGITDNIPVDKCLETGCDKILVVLTHPDGYEKHENLTGLGRIFYRKFPALIEAFRHRDENYNARLRYIRELEQKGIVKVLRPSKSIKVGRLESDPERLKALYELGYSDMTSRLAEIREYLLGE